jgi:hypothetical protein
MTSELWPVIIVTVPRWPVLICALALVVVGSAISGVAIAGAWDPLAGIGAADRPAEPTDALSAAAKEQLRRSDLPAGSIDQIGTRLVDEARMLGELPDGTKVYALPTSKDKLCIVAAERASSCHDPVTHDRPITFTISKVGPLSPHVIWGATADDVVSVSFVVAALPVTVPVRNNFFAWEGQPTAKLATVSSAIVTFADGTTAPAF